MKKLLSNIHFIFPFAALAADFLLYYVFIYMQRGFMWPQGLGFYEYWRENWLIVIQLYVTLYLVYYSILYFNKRFVAAPHSITRFIREILFVSLTSFVLEKIFLWIFISVIVVPDPDPKFLHIKLRMLQTVSITFTLVLYAIMTSLRIYQYLQQKQLELVKWQREYTQSQFEGLKNQLNPHFLFNSLSALTSLVYVDADKAEEFIEKLSKTYRYLLEQKDKEKVSLKKEMEFFEGYKYLVEQRFGKKLQFKIQIDEAKLNKELPPHSLMIALEYIIANNAMSAAKPLVVELFASGNNLHIKYCCNAKRQIESNSEKQLMTLKERYNSLVPGRPMEIIRNGETSTIEYALL